LTSTVGMTMRGMPGLLEALPKIKTRKRFQGTLQEVAASLEGKEKA